MIDRKKIEEWKRLGAGVVSDPVTTWQEPIRPLIEEVERLRSRLLLAEALLREALPAIDTRVTAREVLPDIIDDFLSGK